MGQDTDWRGFEWISHEDNRNNIIAFRRVAKDGSDIVVVVNFSPEEQQEYRIGVPITGTYEEIFTSDKTEFGGSGMANGKLKTENKPMHGQEQSIVLKIPRFGVLFFKGKARAKRRTKAEIEAAKSRGCQETGKAHLLDQGSCPHNREGRSQDRLQGRCPHNREGRSQDRLQAPLPAQPRRP